MSHNHQSNWPSHTTQQQQLETAESSVTQEMEKVLWYLFAGSRGGANRVRIVRELNTRPRNANELADQLDVDYNTITHHLDALMENNIVEPGENDYGQLYFLTDQFENHWTTFETISAEVE